MIPISQSSMRLVRAALAGALPAIFAQAPAPASAQTVGERLPGWTAGTLDIHHVNTGRGNATFFLLPDGTTLLIDAGDGGNPPPRGTHPRPDASRRHCWTFTAPRATMTCASCWCVASACSQGKRSKSVRPTISSPLRRVRLSYTRL